MNRPAAGPLGALAGATVPISLGISHAPWWAVALSIVPVSLLALVQAVMPQDSKHRLRLLSDLFRLPRRRSDNHSKVHQSKVPAQRDRAPGPKLRTRV